MLFTEKDLLNAFKQNVDNKGGIYFVGNPESNAKFIIDCMKANKEEIDEEELNNFAENIVDTFLSSDYSEGSISYGLLKNLVKASYYKAKEK